MIRRPLHRVRHLARRFVRTVLARTPRTTEEAWANEHLLDGERALWVQMSASDRAHALTVAHRFIDDVGPAVPRFAVAAALLHDVGKLDAGLGTAMRVVATVVGPRGDRFRRYHDHEAIGADMLRKAGSEPPTVALVERSVGAPAGLLDALDRADDL